MKLTGFHVEGSAQGLDELAQGFGEYVYELDGCEYGLNDHAEGIELCAYDFVGLEEGCDWFVVESGGLEEGFGGKEVASAEYAQAPRLTSTELSDRRSVTAAWKIRQNPVKKDSSSSSE